jgi:cytochrome c oxidase subunit 2
MRFALGNRKATLGLAVVWIGLAAGGHAQNAASGPEVQMTARKYDFKPDTLTVKKGDHVKLVITAVDRDHGFKIDAFHINQKLPKGQPVTVEFTADQAGTFPFQCSQFCGLGHKKMKGKLVVE